MRLGEFLRGGSANQAEATLLRRFISDAERSQGEWERLLGDLRRTHLVASGIAPLAPAPIPFKQVILNALGDFGQYLNFSEASVKASLTTYIDQKFNAFEYNAHRVAWRYDANNDYILDGINNTSINVVSLERFNGWASTFTLPISRVVNLQSALDGKAGLSGGKHLLSQYADGVYRREWTVADVAALTTLSGAFQGDVADVTESGERYALMGLSPLLASNWFNLATGSNVTSVNSKTGAVTLTAADVGALPANTTPGTLGAAYASHTHLASHISDLNTWLPERFVPGTGLTITEDPATHRLTLAVAASGLNVAWGDISNKPLLFKTRWDSTYIENLPGSFPPSPHTHTRSQISDFAHTHTASDITNFATEAANAVGARVISDTLTVTAPGNGQVRLEVGATASGITVEEADGSPSLRATKLIVDGGELTQIDATTVKLKVTASGAGGTTEMSYAPKYQRTVTVTNPAAVRQATRITVIIRTAFAQNDGRDIRIYTQAGTQLDSAVSQVVNGPNYADYYVTFVDTLDASSSRTYTAKYGDPYAPERMISMDNLYASLNRPERITSDGKLIVQGDNARAYRSANFMGRDNWAMSANPEDQSLPTPVTLGSSTTSTVHHEMTYYSGSESFRVGSFGFSLHNNWDTGIKTPEAYQAASDGGSFVASRVMHQLADGYAWDFGVKYSNVGHEGTVRYQAGTGWTLTVHHMLSDISNFGTLYGPFGSLAVWFGTLTNCRRDQPQTWQAVRVFPYNRATATVGDETAITP